MKTFSRESFDQVRWDEFSANLVYFQGDLDVPEDFKPPGVEFLTQREVNPANRLYYLATAPEHYMPGGGLPG